MWDVKGSGEREKEAETERGRDQERERHREVETEGGRDSERERQREGETERGRKILIVEHDHIKETKQELGGNGENMKMEKQIQAFQGSWPQFETGRPGATEKPWE